MPTDMFYIPKTQAQQVKTATPTGIFNDPLDFVNSTNPWITANTTLSGKSNKKKTLVFADYFHKKRPIFDPINIFNALKAKKIQGFRILILSPTGALVDWDEQYDSLMQVPHPKLYNKEAIYAAALSQHGLTESQILLLDYWGTSSLINRKKIHWSILDDNPNDFFDLIKTKNDGIHFSSLNDVKQLLSLNRNELPIHKLKSFNLNFKSSQEKDLAILKDFFNTFTEIEELDLWENSIENVDLIKKPHLLRKINFRTLTTTTNKIATLFKQLPQLEKVDFFTCTSLTGCFTQFMPGELKKLKEFKLYYSEIDATNLTALLKAAPQLEMLTIHKTPFSLKYLEKNSLKNLKEIDLSSNNLNAEDFINLCNAAPNLEKITIAHCQSVINCLTQLTPCSLKKLKSISLSTTKINAASLTALLKAAPQLTHINFYDCTDLNSILMQLEPSLFNRLKEIDISFTDISLTDLSKMANQLEKITAYNNPTIFNSPLAPEPNLFKNLKEIDISYNLYKVKVTDLVTLFTAAPQLSKIVATWTKIEGDINLLTPEQREKIELSAPTVDLFLSLEDKKISQYNNFDTRLSKAPLSYVRYFSDVNPAEYRLLAWQPKLDTLEEYPRSFQPNDLQPISFEQKDFSTHPDFHCHKGIFPVTSNKTNHAILPSLDSEETIFALQVIDAKGRIVPPDQLKINRSPSTGFHELILPYIGNFTVYYQVAVPNKKPPLPPMLREIVEHYNTFHPATEPHHQSFKTLREVAYHINTTHTGSCEQRSIAAYEQLTSQLKQNPDVRTDIILNDVHAYLEVSIKNQRYKLDLGGYEAILKELPIQTIEAVTEKKVAKVKPFKNYSLHDALDEKYPALVSIESDVAYQDFYNELKNIYSAPDIFIAHRPEDLSVTGPGMTKEGKIKAAYTHFHNWLNDHQQGVIVVDMRNFTASEVAQLNDLLDRTIENQHLSENIRILLLDQPDRDNYGPDFRRRVLLKTHITPTTNVLLKNNDEIPDAPLNQVIEIDLFNSPFWQRQIVGQWQLVKNSSNDALSFQWQNGALLNLIQALPEKLQHIVFKNPPLHDASFTKFIAELQSLRYISWADQTKALPKEMYFYQSTGYDWEKLATQATVQAFTKENKTPFVLSDTNLLSFIQDPCYEFSQETNQLEPRDSYLTRYQNKSIDIVCSPDLSEGALAQLLTEAQRKKVRVQFLTHGVETLPAQHPLHNLNLSFLHEEKTSSTLAVSNVSWQLHEDVYFATQTFLQNHPGTSYFPLECLEASELGRFPFLPGSARAEFLKNSTLSLHAPLSDIAKKLQNGENVILSGNVPHTLYPALTSLTLGLIEGKPFPGKLIILTPPEEHDLAYSLTGKNLPINKGEKISLAQQERENLQAELAKKHPSLTEKEVTSLTDEESAQRFDQSRLNDVRNALAISPWVMIEGPTGTGKTHFLHNILPEKQTSFSLEEWLTAKNERTTLVIDEANFMSELSNQGAHFLERFKSLKANPPSFLWQGKNYPLTPQHKVIFAFNQASYGGGRNDEGFLSEHRLVIPFEPLPDFYLRARIITPLLQAAFKDYGYSLNTTELDAITQPVLKIYQWIIQHNDTETFITPRELKATINIIASRVILEKINNTTTLSRLATEVAYDIGRQTLTDHQATLNLFDQAFKAPQRAPNQFAAPLSYPVFQHPTFRFIKNMLCARKTILSEDCSDLGLGGIILEGGSGIGKTYFIDKIIRDRVRDKIIRISPSTPFHEKEKLLHQATEEGAIIVAEEFNTSLWPNKLLNNFLMGLDEKGNPAKNPGFLLATQNPSSFDGRLEEDPAVRRRVVKLKLDWPVYQAEPKEESKQNTQLKMTPASTAGLFKQPRTSPIASHQDIQSTHIVEHFY